MTKKIFLSFTKEQILVSSDEIESNITRSIGDFILHDNHFFFGRDFDACDTSHLIQLALKQNLTEEHLSGVLYALSAFTSPLGEMLPLLNKDFLLEHREILPSTLTFYSGSFFPWHEGHSECVRQGLQEMGHLIIVPDFNPRKENLTDSSAEKIKQILSQLPKSPRLSIFYGLLASKVKTPTYQWISWLRKNSPTSSLGLVMGDDSFLGIESWIESHQLLSSLNDLLVVPRLSSKGQLLQTKSNLGQRYPHLRIKFLLEHSYQHLSSTALRKK